MFRTAARSYSTGGPGFLSDLLARIEAIPEKGAAMKKVTGASSGQKSGRNLRVNLADHPLARFTDASPSHFGGSKRFDSGNRSKGFNNRSKDSQQRPKRYVKRTNVKMVKGKTFESKELVHGPYEPELNATLFHDRSSNINHSLTSRVASVTKEILLESKYPYKFPRQVIEAAPKEGNPFVLQNNYNADVSSEVLKQKLNATVKGKVVEIDLQENKIPKGLKNHAIFTKKNLMMNPDFNVETKQKVYNVVSGISPVSSLVEGCHWIKK
ncbi:hypothetical protein CAAN1_11S02146 [[Candida] anglica]|uniref:Uncharacterized protein n=1 Tax=[Candida] anglica TaxID=148631 RepID=A0ABP0ELP2_9ASCO